MVLMCTFLLATCSAEQTARRPIWVNSGSVFGGNLGVPWVPIGPAAMDDFPARHLFYRTDGSQKRSVYDLWVFWDMGG